MTDAGPGVLAAAPGAQAGPARRQTLRRAVLAGLLALTGVAALWVPDPETDDVAVVLPGRAGARQAAPRSGPAGSMPATASTTAPDASAWPAAPASRAWASAGVPGRRATRAESPWGLPPAPAPLPARAGQGAAPEPSPPPVAPPFPYQFIGRLEAGPATRALLTGPVSTLAVAPGDAIDGQWRVDRIDPHGLLLTWLPGNQPLTLTLPAAS